MSAKIDTLADLLAVGAQDAPALNAVGRAVPLRYEALRQGVARMLQRLTEIGIGRDDRVAIVLDGGPEIALCFLAVASCCAAAPLNPAYKSEEFEFYLTDLQAKL